LKTLSRLNAAIPPKIRWLLVFLVCLVMIAITVVMAPYLISLVGKGHWTLSAQDRGSGMTIWVHNSDSALEKFTVVVEGYSLGRDIAPVVIDRTGPGLPRGMTLTDEDISLLPGYFTLEMGPLKLDVGTRWLEANGKVCRPGEEITVRVPPPP
jgi:hypothetical protein